MVPAETAAPGGLRALAQSRSQFLGGCEAVYPCSRFGALLAFLNFQSELGAGSARCGIEQGRHRASFVQIRAATNHGTAIETMRVTSPASTTLLPSAQRRRRSWPWHHAAGFASPPSRL